MSVSSVWWCLNQSNDLVFSMSQCGEFQIDECFVSGYTIAHNVCCSFIQIEYLLKASLLTWSVNLVFVSVCVIGLKLNNRLSDTPFKCTPRIDLSLNIWVRSFTSCCIRFCSLMQSFKRCRLIALYFYFTLNSNHLESVVNNLFYGFSLVNFMNIFFLPLQPRHGDCARFTS